MARTTTTTKKGTNPFVAIMIFVVGIAFIAVLLFTLKAVYPEALTGLLGSPDARLQQENADLSAQLNQSQTEVGSLRVQLADAKSKKIAWGLAIGIIVVALLALLYYHFFFGPNNRGLTLEEAEEWAIPRARKRYGFPEDFFPQVKRQSRAFERVKHKAGSDDNEVMYFIELQFIEVGDDNRYYHGLHGHRMMVVTLAMLNRSYLYRHQWYDWLKIDQAMKTAHNQELWGFGLQKTKLDEDILAAVESVRNVNEIKNEFAPEDGAGGE